MPKIKNVIVSAWWESEKRDFDVVLMYTSNVGFYIEIPEELQPVANFLNDNLIEKYCISYIRGRSISINCKQNNNAVTVSDSEKDCLSIAQSLFTYLCRNSIKYKDVIVVYFDDKLAKYNSGTNKEHPKDGFTYGLCYCIEEKVGDTGEAKYYQYITTPADYHFKESTRKIEVSLYGNNYIVIDDIPQNRELLEHTYRLYIELKNKLKTFLGDKEQLLTLIASNQKLIA